MPREGKVLMVEPAPVPAKERILRAADRLFYGEGIRAVGVDRVVTEAGVTRVTFYRHFPSKDHLISAYLSRRLQRDRDQLEGLRATHPNDPETVLAALAEALVAELGKPGFRGCAFANVTAEYCDEVHPARPVAQEHQAWLLDQVGTLLGELGHARPEPVAEQLVMLRAGAMALSAVGHRDEVDTAFRQGWATLTSTG
jgi:AcrR family transcriptional regulator